MTGPRLSVITPAKNAANFIHDAIASLPPGGELSWELIIVNDGSTDETRRVVLDAAERDPRIRVIDNPGRGKVSALNTGFAASSGEIITTLDADDAFHSNYFEFLRTGAADWDAVIRDYWVTDSEFRTIGRYQMSRELLRTSADQVFSRLISLPRATWTFTRAVADKVFPVPEELPFEDVWFSLAVKCHAGRIIAGAEPMYYYRQHEGQTFGGVLNYSPKVVKFRAGRLHAYAVQLPHFAERFSRQELPSTEQIRLFYELLAQGRLTISDIVGASLPCRQKLRLLVFRKAWFLVSILKRIQWAITRLGS